MDGIYALLEGVNMEADKPKWKLLYRERLVEELLEARKTIESQQAKIDALADALRLFGAHMSFCGYTQSGHDMNIVCNCGLRDALKLARGK